MTHASVPCVSEAKGTCPWQAVAMILSMLRSASTFAMTAVPQGASGTAAENLFMPPVPITNPRSRPLSLFVYVCTSTLPLLDRINSNHMIFSLSCSSV